MKEESADADGDKIGHHRHNPPKVILYDGDIHSVDLSFYLFYFFCGPNNWGTIRTAVHLSLLKMIKREPVVGLSAKVPMNKTSKRANPSSP